MKMQLAKGVRDFPPEEKIPRQELVDSLRKVFETYGFVPLETPSIERLETFQAKGGAGEEADVVKETFRFKDQGDRELGLRFDLTVPLARYVAMNQAIRMPFKRYEIGRVYRDGPIKTGRYREFWQCDIDTIGCKDMIAEAELLTIAEKSFKNFNLDVRILVNNRKLLTALVEKAGIPADKVEDAIIGVDKLDKLGPDGVRKDLVERGFSEEQVNSLLEYLAVEGSNSEKLNRMAELVGENEGLAELRELFSLVQFENVIFMPTLARGLAYYTGTVWEVFSKDESLNFSLAGGGRYDNMIGEFSGNKEVPAVGMAFGLEPILETLRIQQKLNERSAIAKAYVIPIGKLNEAFVIANLIRDAGISTDIDLLGRGPGKNFQYVDKAGIPYAVIIGDKEVSESKVTLKNMGSGDEKMVSVEEAIRILKE